MVGCVEMDAYTIEGGLDGFFGATVKHLWLDFAVVGIPGDKHKLRRGTTIGCLEL